MINAKFIAMSLSVILILCLFGCSAEKEDTDRQYPFSYPDGTIQTSPPSPKQQELTPLPTQPIQTPVPEVSEQPSSSFLPDKAMILEDTLEALPEPAKTEQVSTEDNASLPKEIKTNSEPAKIKFSELYGVGSSRGLVFSEKLQSLANEKVVMSGFMAPPLKPSLDFFVLTAEPLAICPFCDSDASWPNDIILIYMANGKKAESIVEPIKVTGRLEIGSHIDEDTGFVSQIRIYAENISIVK